MKTSEELKELKENFRALNEKLASLTPEELTQVFGGADKDPDNRIIINPCPYCGESAGFFKLREIAGHEHWHCDRCGDMTYLRHEHRWERGHI